MGGNNSRFVVFLQSENVHAMPAQPTMRHNDANVQIDIAFTWLRVVDTLILNEALCIVSDR